MLRRLVGSGLRQLRRRHHLTQLQLARKLRCVNRSAISRFEIKKAKSKEEEKNETAKEKKNGEPSAEGTAEQKNKTGSSKNVRENWRKKKANVLDA